MTDEEIRAGVLRNSPDLPDFEVEMMVELYHQDPERNPYDVHGLRWITDNEGEQDVLLKENEEMVDSQQEEVK